MTQEVDRVVAIYETCPACHGRGYWLVPFIKKDGAESKRCTRFPCPQCKSHGASKPRKDLSVERDDDIPF